MTSLQKPLTTDAERTALTELYYYIINRKDASGLLNR